VHKIHLDEIAREDQPHNNIKSDWPSAFIFDCSQKVLFSLLYFIRVHLSIALFFLIHFLIEISLMMMVMVMMFLFLFFIFLFIFLIFTWHLIIIFCILLLFFVFVFLLAFFGFDYWFKPPHISSFLAPFLFFLPLFFIVFLLKLLTSII